MREFPIASIKPGNSSPKNGDPNSFPLVTVIMPVRNEEKFLSRCLDSLLENDYPQERMEFLIADGMSNDSSREILTEYSRRFAFIRVLDNPGRIVPTGLNEAIRQAKGEIIVRVDAHTVFAPDYIRQCVHLLQTTGASNVGGPQRSVGKDYQSEAIAVATTSRFAAGDAKFRFSENEAWVETVYLGAWWKETLVQLGGFNEEWVVNQDFEMNHRLRRAGGKILLSPAIKCEYSVRPSLIALAKQYFRYGFWKVKTIEAYPESLRWRQLVAPGFVAASVASLALAAWMWSPALVLGLVYVLSNLFASAVCAWKRGWHCLPILPLTFAIIHFSWGFGFWSGLFRFGVPRFSPTVLAKALRPIQHASSPPGEERGKSFRYAHALSNR
ncbi:MAG TPA: glycosyltransferase family 2 protein [Candidatus Eisenbacteria bacterium]|nr:glycosyltransferase family 2 protein [Candidatus Eisenbacteria bacterium]